MGMFLLMRKVSQEHVFWKRLIIPIILSSRINAKYLSIQDNYFYLGGYLDALVKDTPHAFF